MYTVPITPTSINGAAVLLLQEKPRSRCSTYSAGPRPPPATATTAAPLGTVEPSTRARRSAERRRRPRPRSPDRASAHGALAFEVTGKGDADSSQYDHTIIRYAKGQEAAARTLATVIESGAELQPVSPAGPADVQIVLGRDFTAVRTTPVTSAPASG